MDELMVKALTIVSLVVINKIYKSNNRNETGA